MAPDGNGNNRRAELRLWEQGRSHFRVLFEDISCSALIFSCRGPYGILPSMEISFHVQLWEAIEDSGISPPTFHCIELQRLFEMHLNRENIKSLFEAPPPLILPEAYRKDTGVSVI